jgi:DNA-binding response OmpR family regulator
MSIQARTLLVDDESAIIENLASFLERFGFEVKTVANGEETLTNIKIEVPELIVSDVLMPKMDGRELLHSLRRDDNWIPLILLTQVGEAFERVMALEEGVDDNSNSSNPRNWLFESGPFYDRQDQENRHSQ